MTASVGEMVGVTDPVATPSPQRQPSRRSANPLRKALRRFIRNTPAVLGFTWLVLLVFCAVFAPLIATHDSAAQGAAPFLPPSSEYLLGTDNVGRDIFSRTVFASRVALQAAFTIVGLALIVALVLGLVAGYIGNKVDYGLMRIMDALSSFPPLVFAIAIAAMLGPGLGNTTIAIAVIFVPGLTRLIRGQALAIREETYVDASRAIGTPVISILARRVLPNLASPLIVQVTVLLGAALLAEASLSFIGLGVQAPDPSWGQMLRRAYDAIFTHPWQMLTPGIAIALTVLSWNVIGDGLRDSMGHQPAKAPRALRKRARLGITSVKRVKLAAEVTASEALLSVRDLEIRFATEAGEVTVVDGVSFDVQPGEVVGIVGESGCGKSMTSLGIMRLVPTPPGWIEGGSVILDGRDITAMSAKELRGVRGKDISMVFQDPMSSLNPAYTIGNQLVETIGLHTKLGGSAIQARAAELLRLVGISDPAVRLGQ